MATDSTNSKRQVFDQEQERLRATRNTKKRGEISELAFVHKAATLGFAVSKPYGDSDRYDFVVHSGEHFWRVQVKSATSMWYGQYTVNIQRHMLHRAIPYTTAEIDFVAAHIVPEDAWFVLPVQAFAPRIVVRVHPKGATRVGPYDQYREAWHLLT